MGNLVCKSTNITESHSINRNYNIEEKAIVTPTVHEVTIKSLKDLRNIIRNNSKRTTIERNEQTIQRINCYKQRHIDEKKTLQNTLDICRSFYNLWKKGFSEHHGSISQFVKLKFPSDRIIEMLRSFYFLDYNSFRATGLENFLNLLSKELKDNPEFVSLIPKDHRIEFGELYASTPSNKFFRMMQ